MAHVLTLDYTPHFEVEDTPVFDLAAAAHVTPFDVDYFFDTIVENAVAAANDYDAEHFYTA